MICMYVTCTQVVRLGHPARLVPWIQMCSLDAILSNSDSGAIVRDVRTDIDLILVCIVLLVICICSCICGSGD